MIDVRLLLQFAKVAECLSFTAAARQLGMGQPRLSAQIRKLEEQLGCALFERSTRRVRLTARGMQLLEAARPLALVARQAIAQAEVLRQQGGAVFRIGVPQLGAPDPMQADLFAGFLRDHPGLSLDVQPGLTVHHAEQLVRGEIDMGLMSVVPDGSGWESMPLYRLAMGAILHGDDPLANGSGPLAPERFAGRRVAVFARRRAPDMHDRLYGPLRAGGAELVEVPELRRSLLRDRPGLIVTTIVAAPAEADLPHGLVRREMALAEALRMHLVRIRSGLRSGAAERFWSWVSARRT